MAATESMRNVDESACKVEAVHGWGTDLTSTMTGEGQASIFITVDHASTECVGIHAARRATRFEAFEPLRQAARKQSA